MLPDEDDGSLDVNVNRASWVRIGDYAALPILELHNVSDPPGTRTTASSTVEGVLGALLVVIDSCRATPDVGSRAAVVSMMMRACSKAAFVTAWSGIELQGNREGRSHGSNPFVSTRVDTDYL